LRLRAGAEALAKFRVVLVSMAALPRRLAAPVPLGHLPFGGDAMAGSACPRPPVPVGRWCLGCRHRVGLGFEGSVLACSACPSSDWVWARESCFLGRGCTE
jgi:hypothetical protein